MDRRTFEGPMDWEYQGSGPFDPTSPFAHAARSSSQSVFASASKPSAQPNLFASRLASPSRNHPPQTSLFSPQITAKNSAPAFRNPAFTTPRKPFDESVFSEASGAEDSPALTETSDVPQDTPEADHTSDVNMSGTTPTKVDKNRRYGKSARKHTSGKGEIRSRDHSAGDLMRKRKRHNYDRDVGSVVRYRSGRDEYSDESDEEDGDDIRSRRKKQDTKRGFFSSLFHLLDEHPNAPENLYKWTRLIINVLLASGGLYLCYAVVDTVRTDIFSANEAARMELMSKMSECQNQYSLNECAKKDRPALKQVCDDWYDCMMQNPESIMRVRVTVKQIAEIINEFSEAMHLKAWALTFGVLLVVALAVNVPLGRHSVHQPAQPLPSHPASRGFEPAMPPPNPDGTMWIQVQTPRKQRHFAMEEETDTDASPPKPMPLLPPYTPSGRRSPYKAERSRSPVKYGRSPYKGY